MCLEGRVQGRGVGDDEDHMKKCVEIVTQDAMGVVMVVVMTMMVWQGGRGGSSKKMEEVGVYTGQDRNCSRGLLAYSSHGFPFTLMRGSSKEGFARGSG